MGQSQSQNYNGICTPKKRSSLRSPFMRRKQRSPLSAVFTAPNSNNIDALNINAATVEQLMTLPGITRQISQGIVEHRTAIGGRFQRVDDLALVSGIGAEKLDKIRSDICVKRKTVGSMNGSCISSRTPSMDSVTSEPIIREQKLIINVNKATVFQLQQINGLNQEIAANLVDYRTRKGNFNCLDDIIKVKGISQARLGAIRIHLSLSDDDLPKTPKLRHISTFSTPTSIKNGYHNNHQQQQQQQQQQHQQQQQNNHRQINRKSMSMPTKMSLSLANNNNNNNNNINNYNNTTINNGFTNAPVHDIFELLGAFVCRPIVEEDYRHERNGFSTIRMTTWNLDRMCFEKSENLGVKEVICRTILENRLSILCLQEILDPSALNNICDELNCPSLKRVQEWRENSKNWKYFVNETAKDGQLNGLGFIYDADFCQYVENDSMEISLSDCIDTNTDSIEPTAYLAAFKLSDWTCYVLNIYLRYFNLLNTNSVLKTIEKQLDKRIKQQQQINNKLQIQSPTLKDVFLVAGDFSGTDYHEEHFYNYNKKQIAKFNKVDELKQKQTKKLQHQKDKEECGENEIKSEATTTRTTTVDIDLQNLGFFSVIETDSTSYNSQIQQPVQTTITNNHHHNNHSHPNEHHHHHHQQQPSVISSCNILCREKLPIKKQTSQHSNDLREQILLNTKMPINNFDIKKEKLTGHSGIVRQGLSHMAIPSRWQWGGSVSLHCPIWVEIYRRINRDEVDLNSTIIRNSTSYMNGGERTRRKLYSKSRSPSVGKKLNSSRESLASRNNYKLSNGGLIGGSVGTEKEGDNYILTNGNLNISSDSVFISQTNK